MSCLSANEIVQATERGTDRSGGQGWKRGARWEGGRSSPGVGTSDQGGGREGFKEWPGSGCILKVGQTGAADRLHVGVREGVGRVSGLFSTYTPDGGRVFALLACRPGRPQRPLPYPAVSPRASGPLPPSAVARDDQLQFHPVDESINTTFICRVTNALGTGEAEQTVLVRGEEAPG